MKSTKLMQKMNYYHVIKWRNESIITAHNCKNNHYEQIKTISETGQDFKSSSTFFLLLNENKIHRLHELIHVAFKAKRSIGYIVSKLVDAIDGIYRPNPSQDDKDLAFLILQFGGPGLLDIVHRAIGFPSTSTAYKNDQRNHTDLLSN